MQLIPFILYGLIGCPRCGEAEEYLKKIGVPFFSFVANGDPIIDEGIKKIVGSEIAPYPVLVYKPTKEIVVSFKPEDYERLARHFYSLSSASVSSSFGGQQPNLPQDTQQASSV